MKRSVGKKRIMVVDDHPLIRLGLTELISKEADLHVCAEASGALDALAALERTKPHLVTLDLLIKGGGFELIKNILAKHPNLPILVVSMRDEAHYAERVLAAGARGYVMKRYAAEKVMVAIRKVLAGGVYLSEAMTTQFLHRIVGNNTSTPEANSISKLSDRELEVFERLGRGLKTTIIAAELKLSIKTVQTYRANIMAKLGLKGAPSLLHRAFQWVQKENI